MLSINKIIAPINHYGNAFTNKCKSAYNKVPSLSVTKNYIIDKTIFLGEKCTSPQQRLIMGITAIMTQPFIDAKNKNIDESTRKASVARTIAKIIVGTATGFTLRYACIKGIQGMSRPLSEIAEKDKGKFISKLKTFLTPKGIDIQKGDALKQYQFTLGTLLSLLIMVYTNFAVDAPLTRILTNKLIKHQKLSEQNNVEEGK